MIPDEAVEAAAYTITLAAWGHMTPHEAARDILEAAAPCMMAAALNDAADTFENLPVNKGAEISSGTWDWFELFPIEHLRERARKVIEDA